MALEPALRSLWGGVPADLALHKLKGDASTRSYYRLTSASSTPASLVVMRLPADALKSDELGSGKRPEELPFLNVQRHLERIAVPVPRVLVADVANGVVLLEDLSDETFEARLRKTPRTSWPALYQRAIEVMVHMLRRARPAQPAALVGAQRAVGGETARLPRRLRHPRPEHRRPPQRLNHPDRAPALPE